MNRKDEDLTKQAVTCCARTCRIPCEIVYHVVNTSSYLIGMALLGGGAVVLGGVCLPVAPLVIPWSCKRRHAKEKLGAIMNDTVPFSMFIADLKKYKKSIPKEVTKEFLGKTVFNFSRYGKEAIISALENLDKIARMRIQLEETKKSFGENKIAAKILQVLRKRKYILPCQLIIC